MDADHSAGLLEIVRLKAKNPRRPFDKAADSQSRPSLTRAHHLDLDPAIRLEASHKGRGR